MMEGTDKSTKALLIIAMGVIVAAAGVTACAPKTPAGGYPAGYADGACTALTGSPGCDYAAMTACQDPRGADRDTTYPCAWISARGTVVIVDHDCPVMVWPDGATCLSVPPADRRAS